MFADGSKGSFTTLQHGEYTLTYIHVPQNFKSIRLGTYFVPNALPVSQRRKLLGRLDQKRELVTRFFVEVLPQTSLCTWMQWVPLRLSAPPWPVLFKEKWPLMYHC